MIPDDVIAQIRDAADIVAVIGEHVQLRRAGTSFKGLCPFHGERTPSFNVVPAKQFFHCFGCQKHGDVFSFVMELEGKSFVEVAEQLAGRFGIVIARVEEPPEQQRARVERLRMLEINKLATAFYRELLLDPRRGEPGRAYLVRRGVTTETAERFQLGYAPAEWGALADHLKARRADLELAVKLGLIAHRPRTSGFYDRNRDRLVCPVIVPGGDIVGFSSRLVGAPAPGPDGSEPPKYINSPESAVYKKGKLLFGLAQARDAMNARKRAVLVEGNFDVISLHQAGFTEVVAPLGTALTPEQLHVLKRLAERVVLLYDGDRAGYKATMHALQLCVEADIEVLVAARPGNARSGGAGILSGGIDPDSLVASGGTEQLRVAVDRALGGIEFFAFEVWGKAAANNEAARARALEEAVRLIGKIANPIKRDLIVGTLATAMNVDEKVVRAAVARAENPHHAQGHRMSASGGPPRPGSGDPSRPGAGPARTPGAHPNAPSPQQEAATSATGGPVAPPPTEELELIALLADQPALIATAEADKAFWLLTDARLRDMYSRAREGQSFLELAPVQLPPPLAKHVLSGKYADAKDPASTLAAMTRNLDARKTGVGLVNLKNSLVDARRRGDHDLARMLALRAVAERKGDRELAARLAEEVHAGSQAESCGPSDPETSNRKQVE
ncbi:MAG TPA: DNA primase [Kofleriaceae bacterium]|jgi:DNA primase|nr:DNA primase [Kofleriaceae bacterium]